MEIPIDICKRNVERLFDLMKSLVDQIDGVALARADRQNISNFEVYYKKFKSLVSSPSIDVEMAISSAQGAAIHAQVLGSGVESSEDFSMEVKSIAGTLHETATEFLSAISSGDEFKLPYRGSLGDVIKNEAVNDGGGSVSYNEKKIIELQTKLRSEIEAFERDIAKGNDEVEQLKQRSSDSVNKSSVEVSELRKSIEKLRFDLSNLNKEMVAESEKAAKISENAAAHSQTIHSQIDDLLGQTASKVLLVDYAETAQIEKRSADIMRFFSLACMALTGGVLCYALYESLSGELDWKLAVFKAFTAVALSVPAAYLAKESAKHREQEHINRRISLDLRAINPYIATLPADEQNKIKSDIASRIFGVKESGGVSNDDYPVNVQELVKLIIEKIPTPK